MFSKYNHTLRNAAIWGREELYIAPIDVWKKRGRARVEVPKQKETEFSVKAKTFPGSFSCPGLEEAQTDPHQNLCLSVHLTEKPFCIQGGQWKVLHFTKLDAF